VNLLTITQYYVYSSIPRTSDPYMEYVFAAEGEIESTRVIFIVSDWLKAYEGMKQFNIRLSLWMGDRISHQMHLKDCRKMVSHNFLNI